MNIFLYIVTVMIWGSTWLAIQFQLGVVPPIWSLVYRFGFAVIILWLYAMITRLYMRFTWMQHVLMFFQGVFFIFFGNLLVLLPSKSQQLTK